jgi:hypothetical protein
VSKVCLRLRIESAPRYVVRNHDGAYGLMATLEMRSGVFISCALDVTIPGVVEGLEFYCTIKVNFAAWVKFVDPDVKLPVTAR